MSITDELPGGRTWQVSCDHCGCRSRWCRHYGPRLPLNPRVRDKAFHLSPNRITGSVSVALIERTVLARQAGNRAQMWSFCQAICFLIKVLQIGACEPERRSGGNLSAPRLPQRQVPAPQATVGSLWLVGTGDVNHVISHETWHVFSTTVHQATAFRFGHDRQRDRPPQLRIMYPTKPAARNCSPRRPGTTSYRSTGGDVDERKKVTHPKIPRREMDFLTPAEVRLLLECVKPAWYPFFLTAVTTGLRIGELLAMKWGNLEESSELYYVREIWARKRPGYSGGFAEPKTDESKQPIDLSPACLDALRRQRKQQAEEKLKAGDKYEGLDLIFATSMGKPLDDKNVVHRQFEPSLEAAGLRKIRFHDLRHTCAALLIDQGESPKYIQRQLRHASIETTFNRYGHLFPEKKREAMRRLDEKLLGTA